MSTIRVKRTLSSALPAAGVLFGELVFVQGTESLHVGRSDGTTLVLNRNISASGGEVTGSGDKDSLNLVLSTTGVTAGEYQVVTVDEKGRVTDARALTAADIPALTTAKITDFTPAVNALISAATASAVKYRGVADASAGDPDAATGETNHEQGWLYKITTEGNAFGFDAFVGDFVIYNGTGWDHWDAVDPAISEALDTPIRVTQVNGNAYELDIEVAAPLYKDPEAKDLQLLYSSAFNVNGSDELDLVAVDGGVY